MLLDKIIKESLNKVLLKESIQVGFDFKELNLLNGKELYDYCIDYLGEPLGEPGSSRVVFEIDDYQVLKLAYGSDGQLQNKLEWEFSKKVNSPLLVKTLYKSNNWNWIISERVIPCREIDFWKLLGIPYGPHSKEPQEEYSEYNTKRITPSYRPRDISFTEIRSAMIKLLRGETEEILTKRKPEYDIIMNHPWFKELFKLCSKDGLDITDIGIPNLGLSIRNNKPTIVILDSGLTLN